MEKYQEINSRFVKLKDYTDMYRGQLAMELYSIFEEYLESNDLDKDLLVINIEPYHSFSNDEVRCYFDIDIKYNQCADSLDNTEGDYTDVGDINTIRVLTDNAEVLQGLLEVAKQQKIKDLITNTRIGIDAVESEINQKLYDYLKSKNLLNGDFEYYNFVTYCDNYGMYVNLKTKSTINSDKAVLKLETDQIWQLPNLYISVESDYIAEALKLVETIVQF